MESSPCLPKRGHGGREPEGPCVCPGWLSQPDSSLLPVLRSSPRLSSPGSHAPYASPTELWDLTSPLSKISGGSGPDLNAKDNYIICLSPRNATASASLVFPFVPFPNKPRKVIPHSLATKPTHNLSATKGAFFTLGDWLQTWLQDEIPFASHYGVNGSETVRNILMTIDITVDTIHTYVTTDTHYYIMYINFILYKLIFTYNMLIYVIYIII